MQTQQIGFIGGGNMARSLIGGLLNAATPPSILVHEPDAERRSSLAKDFAITLTNNNQAIIDTCDTVILAVKPQVMKQVISGLKLPKTSPLFITIAAGIRSQAIEKWLGRQVPVVRAMPNTPALVQSGATGLFANAQVSETQRETAESILRAVGLALWVERESDIDAVTALSGSGPAYFFLVMEAMEQAGKALGLSAEASRLLTIQTAFGAAKLALEIEEEPAELRRRVTSPGGTTERAIQSFEQQQLRAIFQQALTAARDRSIELADQLGE